MSDQKNLTYSDARSAVPDDVLLALRAQLLDLLPRAMACAIASYRAFSAQTAPEDAKQFIAHHNACRAALAHVDYLSKLAKYVQATGPQDSDAHDLQPLIHKAREMLVCMTQTHSSACAEDVDESEL